MRRLEWGVAALLTLLAVSVHGSRWVYAGGLWRDEAGAVRLATLPSLRAVYRLFPHEAFPLAVPMAIRLYARLAGESDQALRGFGLAVGLAGVAALWLSARLAGRTLPLLSLALISSNAAFVVFGDSLRGYGLGSLCILLSFAALARLLARPGPAAATAALLAVLAAVHCLLANAALVAALCAAAAIAALWHGRRRVALAVLNIGLAAGLSLLPYAAPLNQARAWNVGVTYPTTLRQIVRVLGATLGPGPARWLWLGLALLALAGAVRLAAARHDAQEGDPTAMSDSLAERRDRELWLFSALAIVLAIAAQLLFLDVLSYTPRAWYYLPLLALVAAAIEPLVAGLCRAPSARAGRLALALILVAAVLPFSLPRLSLRMTNADLAARLLWTSTAAEDLVLVTPWHYGVSFNRYYRGPARWLTLPDLPDHQIHRFDLVMAKLASPHPLDDVLEEVRRTLAGGHRVWLVGQLRFPRAGQAPPVLPPAPATSEGWHDFPYVESWALQMGAFLRDHAASVELVAVPSTQPISPLEHMSLVVARGWRPGA